MQRFPMLGRNRDGFSLIEIMVVIALIGIIAGFGTPALLSMKAKSSTRADARDVLSTFKYAQSEAVKRSASVTILFNTPATGQYTVFLDNGAGVNTNNRQVDGDEMTLAVKDLRPGSSFTAFSFGSGNTYSGFNLRGLPLSGQGSVEVKSSALTVTLSLSNAGFINVQ